MTFLSLLQAFMVKISFQWSYFFLPPRRPFFFFLFATMLRQYLQINHHYLIRRNYHHEQSDILLLKYLGWAVHHEYHLKYIKWTIRREGNRKKVEEMTNVGRRLIKLKLTILCSISLLSASSFSCINCACLYDFSFSRNIKCISLKISFNMQSVETQNLQFNLRLADLILPQSEFLSLHFQSTPKLLEFTCPLLADFDIIFVQNRLKSRDRFVSEEVKLNSDRVLSSRKILLLFTQLLFFGQVFVEKLLVHLLRLFSDIKLLRDYRILQLAEVNDVHIWISSVDGKIVMSWSQFYTHAHILFWISTSFCSLKTSICVLYRSIVSYLSCIFSSKFCLR